MPRSSAGATSERVYAGLKKRILHRHFRPGDRLDPAALADELLSSVTPVRDALHRLTGERLVEARVSEGFHLPQVDAPSLADLYSWNTQILSLALRSSRPVPNEDDSKRQLIGDDALAEVTGALFAAIGSRSPNVEHRAAIASANDRLHAVRLAEARVFTDLNAEISDLHLAVEDGTDATRSAIVAYHRRRHRRADEIVWTLYRNGGVR